MGFKQQLLVLSGSLVVAQFQKTTVAMAATATRASLVWTLGRERNEPEHMVKPILFEIYITNSQLPSLIWLLVKQFLGWQAELLQSDILNYVYYNQCALHRLRRRQQGSIKMVRNNAGATLKVGQR